MKKFVLLLCIFLSIVRILPANAADYQPLVKTFHDAYLYYLYKAQEAAVVKDQQKVIRYFKLARIYAATDVELLNLDVTMARQLSAQEIKDVKTNPIASNPPVALPVSAKVLAIPAVKLPVFTGTGQVFVKDVKDKQVIEIPLGKTIIIERKGVKRFSIVDEGFVEAKINTHQQLEITAVKRGVTFLHFWDDGGRTTVYVKVIMLELLTPQETAKPTLVEHNQPFKFNYSNDWSSYYEGPKLRGLRRQNLSFLQNLAMYGPTPYGNIDSYITVRGLKNASDIQGYTLGVSDVPIPRTENVNLRFFDAMRKVSPLTLSSVYMRGMFADADVLQKNLRFSYSHGQVKPTFGYSGFLNSNKLNFFVDAGKVTLFPDNEKSRYALNYVSAYGSDRDPSAPKSVYSIEGQQKIAHVTLNAELASNEQNRNAVNSGLRYENAGFTSAFNVRNINREYGTVFGPVSSQGEIGAVWTTNTYTERFEAQTVLDIYRNRLYFNETNPNALNFDLNGHVRVPFNSRLWSDSGVFYVDTPGDFSPRRNFGLNERVSFRFDTWGKRYGTLYTGGAYQRSRYANAERSAFDRLTAVVGTSIPLTDRLSIHDKYEYSWVDEPFTGDAYNPSTFDIGLNYNRSLTTKLLGTWALNYQRQDGVGGTNSFLSGEDSVDGSFSLNYNPVTDMNFFLDSRLRRVWPKDQDIVAYYALDVRLGMRLTFGSGVKFDPYGKVYGYVFNDVNSNGLRERGEAGLAHVKVKVGEKEVETDNKGYFEKGYSAKSVVVAPNGSSIPSGFVFSTKESLRVPINSVIMPETNFGVTAHASVYGIVYVDKNGNGQPDQGDLFIPKVGISLDGKEEQYTDNRGSYYFRNVSIGKHTAVLQLDSIPIEYLPLTKLKHSIDVAQGATVALHFPMRVKEQQ